MSEKTMERQAREWLCDGGGGFEGGEYEIRACTMGAEWAIELMAEFARQAISQERERIAGELKTKADQLRAEDKGVTGTVTYAKVAALALEAQARSLHSEPSEELTSKQKGKDG